MRAVITVEAGASDLVGRATTDFLAAAGFLTTADFLVAATDLGAAGDFFAGAFEEMEMAGDFDADFFMVVVDWLAGRPDGWLTIANRRPNLQQTLGDFWATAPGNRWSNRCSHILFASPVGLRPLVDQIGIKPTTSSLRTTRSIN